MAKFITADGVRMRVGSPLYRWYRRNHARLIGDVPKPKPAGAKLGPRALKLAGHYVGVKEHPAGSNMQMFGRWFGADGVPWCAIFVSYVLSHAGRPFRYSYVPAIVADARAGRNGLHGLSLAEAAVWLQRGRVVLACFDWTHDGTADHVAFVSSITGYTLHTVEGNTGDAAWSAGGEVLREARSAGLVQVFVGVDG